MRKTVRMLRGDPVVAAKKIVYLPDPPEMGLNVIPQGMRGEVVKDSVLGRRTVKFDDGQVVETSVKDLTSPSMLDRIAKAIFTDQ